MILDCGCCTGTPVPSGDGRSVSADWCVCAEHSLLGEATRCSSHAIDEHIDARSILRDALGFGGLDSSGCDTLSIEELASIACSHIKNAYEEIDRLQSIERNLPDITIMAQEHAGEWAQTRVSSANDILMDAMKDLEIIANDRFPSCDRDGVMRHTPKSLALSILSKIHTAIAKKGVG